MTQRDDALQMGFQESKLSMFLDEVTGRMVIPFMDMGTQEKEEALQGRESSQFGAWRICMFL